DPRFVATIGGFDGIHLGHRALIGRTRQLAAAQNLASMVISFEPLPKEYFAQAAPVPRLTTFRERWRLLEADGPDIFCVLPFNEALRQLRAPEFARMLAAAGIGHLVVGHDFRAAYRGEADVDWFRRHAPELGMGLHIVDPVEVAGGRVSSRRVREALQAGDLRRAAALLGRNYSMRGRVMRGEQLGRELGYPTANLRLARRQTPMDGIFAIRVHGLDPGAGLGGVASLGTRPTVGGTRPLLEAHVFDFAGDLYGREIEVEFIARLREERKFESLDAMVEQMHQDAADARSALAADLLSGDVSG
ncbi:MAG TPA: bifunctional riboflavin kinase/FAD synthetase, partial [Steroidobacteraceae bacterium]|nr:bifunctional riboflavin kinase/FAD synthetase [Steroidobacteraceae bacterium]